MAIRLAVIDSSITNYAQIVDGLAPGISVIIIDSTQDGWTQLAGLLANYADITTLDIVSHGAIGSVQLGNTAIDSTSLASYSQVLADIGNHMAPGGDILLYGCGIAAGTQGQSFIDQFALAAQVDVAASTDPTGTSTQGGNWVLEAQSSGAVIDVPALNFTAFAGTLAVANLAPNAGAGISFNAAQTFAVNGQGPYSVSLGDLNGDGRLDIVTADNVSNQVSVLTGNGAGGFSPAQTFAVNGLDPESVTLGDVNGDGRLDIVTADRLSDQVSVLTNNGAGGFNAAQTMAVNGHWPSSVKLGDVNGDGRLDIVTSDYGSGQVSVLTANGAGGFNAAQTFAVLAVGPLDVSLGDVNGDGRLDIVTADYVANQVSVLAGNGTGGFNTAQTFAVNGLGPMSVALGDINGDGKLDIVTADDSSNQVSVLTGNGAGGFNVAQTFIINGGSPESVSLADLNGDGRLDIVTADYISNQVSVLTGNGAGGFNAELTIAVNGIRPISVGLGDVNGDGRLDIVTADQASNQVSVLASGLAPILTAEDTTVEVRLQGSDADGSVTSFKLSSLPASGTAYLDAALTHPVDTTTVIAASANTAIIYFKPDANWNGSTTLNYLAVDNLGAVSVISANQPITVTAVNDAPVNTVPGTQTMLEGLGKGIAGVSVSDADSGTGVITTTLHVGHGIVTSLGENFGGQFATVVGSGTDNATITGTLDQVNASLATLAYVGNANYSGQDTLSVSSSDGQMTDTDTVAITVTAVNNAPSFVFGKAILPVGTSFDAANSVLLQPDGKIVLAGSSFNTANDTYDFSAVRLNADGTFDASFNGTGKIILPVGIATDVATSAVLQPDGKIVLGGVSIDAFGASDASIVRLNADGTLDTTFNHTGKLIIPVGPDTDFVSSITLQPDGKIVLGGSSYNPLNGSYDFSLLRLNANGTVDASLNGSGRAIVPVGSGYDQSYSVTVQPDGKIFLAGTSRDALGNSDFSFVRLNANGTLDTSFNGTGKNIISIGLSVYDYEQASSVTLQPDGKIVIAGYDNSNYAIIRLNTNGTLDTSFNGTGKAIGPMDAARDGTLSVALQPDGKILLGGSSYGELGNANFSLVRLNSNGTLDTSLEGTGKVVVPVGSSSDNLTGIALQPDGRIVLAGSSSNLANGTTDYSVVRLNSDGSLDTSFNANDGHTLGSGANYTENDMPVALDASVMINDAELSALNGGLGNYDGASVTLMRHGGAQAEDHFSGAGSMDIVNGQIVLSEANGALVVIGAAIESGGSLQLDFNSNATQARVNTALSQIGYSNASEAPPANVNIDWTFNDGNAAETQGVGGALSAVGHSVVAISSINDAPSFRAHGDGGGTTAGEVDLHSNGRLDMARSVALQLDGKIVMAGISINPNNGRCDYSLVRVNSDGSLDLSFADGGSAVVPFTVADDVATSVAIQGDGKIVLGGYRFNPESGTSDYSVVRLNGDGTLDTSFNGSGKASIDIDSGSDSAYSIALQGDGKILLAGSSQDPVTGSMDYSVVRLNVDGSLDSSFDGAGATTLSVGTGLDAANSIVIQADGKILLGGISLNPETSGFQFSLVRLNADGARDPSFNGSGLAFIPVGFVDDIASSVVLQSDGKILIGGSSVNPDNGTYDYSVVRLNADGSLDTGFNGSGKVLVPVGTDLDQANSISVQADGKIVLAGFSYDEATDINNYSIIRLNVDGSLDASFNEAANAVLANGSYNDQVLSVVLQNDGKIVLGGENYRLIRLNTDGSLDTTFNADTLDNTVTYYRNGEAVVLDASVQINDPELSVLGGGLGNYHGASLTLARHGGASSDDHFIGTGNLSLAGDQIVLTQADGTSVVIGATTELIGVLRLDFNENATKARVNSVLSQIGYSNSSVAPVASVTIDWSFSDGNTVAAQGSGGSLSTMGSTVVNIATLVPTVNAAPMSASALLSASEDVSVVLGASQFAFADADAGDSLQYVTIETLPVAGSLTLGGVAVLAGDDITAADLSAGKLVFTPGANESGNGYASIGFSVSDGQASSAVQVLTLNVTPVNDAPVSDTPAIVLDSSAEDEPRVITSAELLSTWSDADQDSLSIINLAVSQGSLQDNGDGTWTYVPPANASGLVTLNYAVTDGQGAVVPASAGWEVTPVNDAPVAPDTATPLPGATEVQSVVITSAQLLVGWSDVDGDSLSVVDLTVTAGHLVDNGDGSWTYTAAPGVASPVEFSYQVSDGQGGLVPAATTLDLTRVDNTPQLGGDPIALPAGQEDQSDYVVRMVDLLHGWSNAYGDALQVQGLVADHGSFVDQGDGSWLYVPEPDYNGAVQLSYTVSNGQGNDAATALALVLQSVNDAPVNTLPGDQSVDEDVGLAINNLSVSDADIGSGLITATLHVGHGQLSSLGQELGVQFASVAGSGTGTVVVSGTLDQVNASLASVAYQGDANFHGADSLTLSSSDGQITTTDQIAITVNSVNDAPEISVINPLADGREDTPVALSAALLLQGITDADGDVLVIADLAVDQGAISGNAASGWVYTPPANYFGPVVFSYTVTDGLSDPVAITRDLTLASVNDVPVLQALAADQQAAQGYDFVATLPADMFADVEDGASLAITASLAGGAPLPTWLSFDASTGTFSGTPSAADATTGTTPQRVLNIVVSATDSDGASVSDTFVLTVFASRTVTGTAVANTLVGNLADETFLGLGGNDTISGLGGNDTLDGGTGADSLIGGAGNDTYIVDAATDVVVELAGEGVDTVNASVTTTLSANVENLVLTGLTAINATGNALDNLLTGNSAANVLSGVTGIDTLIGGAGNDTYVVDSADDVIVELAGQGIDTVQTSAASYTLGAEVENLTITGTAAGSAIGNELANTLTGNAADNLLDGQAGADRLVGGAGNDTYVIDTVSDAVVETAAQGTDTVITSVSGYTLAANAENLVLTGGATTGTGNTADNVITANSVLASSLNGGTGNDTLIGGASNDTLSGAAGNDVMQGGAGDDSYVVDVATDVVTELVGEGTDSVSAAITYILSANVENLTLTGITAINATGNAGANSLTGNSAANVLDGLAGADTMAGAGGNDTYNVDNAGDVVVEVLNQGTDLVQASVSYTLGDNVENLTLTGTAAINATGNALANTLTGNAADNVLDGGAGIDRTAGGLGNDSYVIDSISDVVTESLNQGTDTVIAQVSGYTLAANVENLTLAGAAVSGTGNTGDNVITGNSLASNLNGGAGNDTLIGGAGNDTLTGAAGNDQLQGGAGNDSYVVDVATDVIVELAGGGTDSVSSAVTYTLSANVETLTLTGTLAINGTGSADANTITGNSGANVLDGAGGADTLVGGLGNDSYIVDNVGDVVVEALNQGTELVQASVSHTLAANVENLTLIGTAVEANGNDLINRLIGNASANRIDGGLGSDSITGGAGNDQFIFDTARGTANVDTITDFTTGDLIVLDAALYGGIGLHNVTLDATMLRQGAGVITAGDANDHLIFNTTNGALYYDPDGAGGVAATQFATLTGVRAITAGAIYVADQAHGVALG